jgi:hypothetical protein
MTQALYAHMNNKTIKKTNETTNMGENLIGIAMNL